VPCYSAHTIEVVLDVQRLSGSNGPISCAVAALPITRLTEDKPIPRREPGQDADSVQFGGQAVGDVEKRAAVKKKRWDLQAAENLI
jgi:hypothetical protein